MSISPTARRHAALASLAALALVLPAAASAQPSCHCYRERTFDPERPAAADPYILAAARSSLLSAAFGPTKAELVRAAMGGTAPEDLWIAHWCGARLKRPAGELLQGRRARGSWRAALDGTAPGAPLQAALARGAGDAELAGLAVDDVLMARMGADPAELRALRSAGATSEEVVVAALVARHSSAPALPLLLEVRAGRRSWGAVLASLGLKPADLDGLVRRLVR